MRAISGANPRRLSDIWRDNGANIDVFSDARVSLRRYTLNEMAAFIWKLCDGCNNLDTLTEAVIAACDSPPPKAAVRDDIARLLRSLRKEGLLDWEGDRSVDVLLVVPPRPFGYLPEAIETPEYSAPPLGLCYLAASLRQQGRRVAILDLHQSAGRPEDVIEACRVRHPAIVGITATTPSFKNAEWVARFVKAFDASISTIIGGPHPTCQPSQSAHCSSIDFVCVGEGEETICEFAQAILSDATDPHTVPGLAFVKDGAVRITPARMRCQQLDRLPIPARDLLELDRYAQRGSLISTRGCPMECDFCSCTVISGKTYRSHSVSRVVTEMHEMESQFGCSNFDFHDDTFNLYPERVTELCSAIKHSGRDWTWGCFCRASSMTSEMARQMAGAGCTVIQYGVESGSAAVLAGMRKATTLEQVKNAVTYAADAGVKQVVCGFIIGHANDTETTIRETFDFGLKLKELGASRLVLSLLTPYPGTAVYEERSSRGIQLLTEDWEQYTFSKVVCETRHLNYDQLRSLYSEGVSMFLEASAR